MHFLYIGAFPQLYVEKLSHLQPGSFSNAAQKYNWLLLNGLRNNNVSIEALCLTDPLAKAENYNSCQRKLIIENNINYHFCPYTSNHLKREYITQQFISSSLQRIYKEHPETITVLDCLSPYSWIAAHYSNNNCIILTDIPSTVYKNTTIKNMIILNRLNNTINKADSLVLLSAYMNDIVNKNFNIPSLVIEGIVSSTIKKYNLPKKKQLLYTGSISIECGIPTLVKAFLSIKTDYHLVFYGNGNYADQLRNICQLHNQIEYRGIASNDVVMREQAQSMLLVNPRPESSNFSIYSFPSKNLEYMSSGTPSLVTKLKSMPPEYYPYVLLFPNSSLDGIKLGLCEALTKSNVALSALGKKAQAFVLNKKSNDLQANRLLCFLKMNEVK